jgi:cell division protease FtsH
MSDSNKKKNAGGSKVPGGDSFWFNLVTSIVALVVLAGAYTYFAGTTAKPSSDIAISQLAQDISAGKVTSIVVDGDDLTIEYNDKTEKTSKKEPDAALTQTLANYSVDKGQLDKVSIAVKRQSTWEFWAVQLIPFLAPLVLILAFVWYLSRQMKGAGMQAFSFGQSKPRLIDPNDANSRVTFKDVAGAKEAKEELIEVVDFLRNPRKFLDIGARIPKGILLMGGPGTGKTLLARAVAGEAGVPFFSISGSEFVEMFVGVGASRVRDLFLTAKKAAPSIIFVDEIDAVGRVRGTGVGGGNDEREQTLNQILVEMDGFEPNEKVIVMAAVSRSTCPTASTASKSLKSILAKNHSPKM